MNALTVDQVGRSVGRASRTTVFERSPASPSAVAHALGGTTATPFWLDDVRARRVDHEPLAGDVDADLVIVGGGYTGLWTALRAIERQPGLRVVLLEAETVGWAASGRNGGFCEASLTHGDENGRSRWPDEIDALDRLGLENLDDIEADRAPSTGWTSTSSAPGILARRGRAAPGASGSRSRDAAGRTRRASSTRRRSRAEVASPTYLARPCGTRRSERASCIPAKLAARARPRRRGARASRSSSAPRCAASTTRARPACEVVTDGGRRARRTAPCSRRTCSRRCSSATGS